MKIKFSTFFFNISVRLGAVLCLVNFSSQPTTAQVTPADSLEEDHIEEARQFVQVDKISVFIDCRSCDNAYIRQELNFVNHVRDPKLAQVHVFITTQATGSGGRMFTISFIGRAEFEGINNSLTHTSLQTNSRDEERTGLNAVIKLGLVPYIAHTSLAPRITLSFSDLQVEQAPVDDPWQNWIFEVYGGMNFAKQTSLSSLNIRYGFSAGHVTESWRISLRPYFNYNQRDFIKDQQTIRSILHRNGFYGRIVRSISDHWSTGLFNDVISSTYRNIQFGYSVAPAIEYSFFPYKEALRKEITIAYSVGYLNRKYMEETIYHKLQETLYNQSLELGIRIRQPWGSVIAELEGSHFLHDPSKNRLSFESNVSVRVFKGLSVRFSSDLEVVRDQLSLPKGDASLEDILLQQRQLATTYEVALSVGISYSFGSIYNNVVNTRL
jgi:hypothetical protein